MRPGCSDRSEVIPPAGPSRMDRPGQIQSGMNVNTNTFQTGLSCALCFGTTHARQIAVKSNNGRQGNKSKDICDFRTGLM